MAQSTVDRMCRDELECHSQPAIPTPIPDGNWDIQFTAVGKQLPRPGSWNLLVVDMMGPS